ncbi:MAG TPA: potassium-transporting ATPase subunit KdpA [Polyangiaceae bacterium]|jgi:K+-transporting ATPase ATPase A chain|nr:potassium-transporting ATPase subunit KdpA [Polyangiaceae bacterium]
MSARFFLVLFVYFALVAVIAWPLGRFITRVFAGTNALSRKVGAPLEHLLYRWAGVDPNREQTWKSYALAVLGFSLFTQLITYMILRLQASLPLNPAKFGAVAPWLAFNTATSFTTNTNWQSYGGETTMSYLSQAVALTSHNFFSAGVGIVVAIALIRGIARHETDKIGNFWVDLVRVHLYVLLPICVLFALFLVSQGVIQNFMHPTTWSTLDGSTQTLMQGPVASQEAIKMLGTNGGGYFNANSAHPFENPTPLSDFVQILSIFSIGGALCITLGEMVGNRRHGWAVFITMALLSIAAVFVVQHFEAQGNPLISQLGVDQTMSALQPGGNMEGKELRFGIPDSSLFTVVTTDASCGAVNTMHDSLMPLAGLIPLLNIQLGEIVFGGVGSGMYGMLVFVILAIFLSGLMIGRTPEYVGKKIDSRDVRFASFYILVMAVLILGMTSIGLMTDAGRSGILNAAATEIAGAPWKPHPHGFSEVLYAFSSGAGNNGSAFAGLTAYSNDHPIFYSLTLAINMLFGRFLPIVAVLAIAGNMAKKKRVPPGPSSFPVGGGLFVALLSGTILLVGALTFFPMLSFGPIVEHLQLTSATATH